MTRWQTQDQPDLLRVDEVPERVPFRLIPGPTIGKFRRRISNYRSENDLPSRGRTYEAVF